MPDNLTTMRRQDDALREIRRAEELDPLSLPVKNHAATLLLLRREFDLAVDQSRKIIAIDPGYYLAYSTMGMALLGKHKYREAVEVLSQGWTLSAHRDPMASPRSFHASIPRSALRRSYLRQEPSALAAHAGICAGGRPQGRSLPQ